MALNVDTYDIQLDAAGAAAVRQTLDALGVKAEAINDAIRTVGNDAGEDTGGLMRPAEWTVPARQAALFDAPADPSQILAAIARTNDLLAAILPAIENRPMPQQPTY
jgi:hypothetical protein